MARWKIAIAVVLTVLLLILVLQNTEPVETRFLMATVTMPRAALLGVTGLIGFAIGLLLALRLSGKSKIGG